MNKIYLRALLVWIILIPVAIINGGLRTYVYAPIVGEYNGHIISTIIFILLLITISGLLIRSLRGEYEKKEPVIIGIMWLTLSIVFEFIFGHYVMGNSWELLLADYNILEGRVWSLVLITTFFAPIVWGKYYQE